MPSGIPLGGPRPTNTLGPRNDMPNIRTLRDTAASRKPAIQKPLFVETVRGRNVQHVHSSVSNEAYDEPPSAKRRKMEAPRTPINLDISSSSGADDPLNTIPPKSLIIQPFKKASRTPSFQNDRSRSPSQPTSGGVGGVSEYRNVESRMQSGTRSKKQRKIEQRKSSQEAEYVQPKSPSHLHAMGTRRILQDITPSQDKIEVIDSDSFIEGSKQDTATRIGAAVTQEGGYSHRVHGHSGEISKFFSSTPRLRSSFEARDSTLPESRAELVNLDTHLEQKFVDTEGKRRGESGLPSSPDELTSGTTVGKHASLQPVSPKKKPRRDKGCAKSTNGRLSTQQAPEEVLANPSREISDERANNSTRSKRIKAREAPEPWAVGLSAVNLPSGSCLKNDNIGLVYDETSDLYLILLGGNTFTHCGLPYRINVKKVQKILFEEGGCKMRFLSSKEEGKENIFDISITHKDDVVEILTHMQRKCPIQCIGKDSVWMQNAFQNRRNEPPKLRSRPADEEDTTKPAATQGPANMTKPEWERQMQVAYEPRTKLVHSLMNKVQDTLHTRSLPREQAVSKKQYSGSKMEAILSRLKPQYSLPDRNLRRSARTSGLSTDIPNQLTLAAEESPPLKYSQTVGLGTKWKRPLTYPKAGKKQATIDWVDLEKLDEGEFLNDAIVTFYMRYLEHEMEETNPALSKRIYFFSTYFYERLTHSPTGRKEINYTNVQKWTKNVDIFTYDYVVVPVNEAAHWYLAIMCNLPALHRRLRLSDQVQSQGDDVRSSEPSPDLQGSSASAAHPERSNEEQTTEETTRESFAELNLDEQSTELDRLADGSTVPSSDDKAIVRVPTDVLNGQHVPEVSKVEELEAQEAKSPVPGTRQPYSEKPSPKGKKRKSMPAVTHTDPRLPLIMTLDSLGGLHPSAMRYLKDYLSAEARTKRGGMEIDISSIKGINAKSIPQQSNFSDCGLYMLGYLEKFMRDGADSFIAKTIRREHLDNEWAGLNPSKMRDDLRSKIFALHKAQEEEQRITKANKKQHEGEPSASNLAKAATGQKGAETTCDAAAAEGSPPLPILTRSEALVSAQSLDGNGPGEQPDLSSIDSVVDQHLREAAPASSGKPVNQLSELDTPEDESVMLLDSQPQNYLAQQNVDSSHPATEYYPEQRAISPALPSQIEDSQEQMRDEFPQTVHEDCTLLPTGRQTQSLQPPQGNKIEYPKSNAPLRSPTPANLMGNGSDLPKIGGTKEVVRVEIGPDSMLEARVEKQVSPQSPRDAGMRATAATLASEQRKRSAEHSPEISETIIPAHSPLAVSKQYSAKRSRKRQKEAAKSGVEDLEGKYVIQLDDD